MSTETTTQTISDIVDLSDELYEGDEIIKGQIRLYDVDSGGTLESDARRFYERTLITDGLRDQLNRLRDALTGEDAVRTHILYGPYGSGKSHQMVSLYHCFNAPEAAADWAGDEIDGFGEALPDSANPIVVALQKSNAEYEYLWEPFFDGLDYDAGSFETGGYPDVDTIQDAIGDQTVAFFVDELEDWFDTLTGRRRSANKGFLQALLEATNDSSNDLYTIVSVLREGSDVHDILNRQETVDVNMRNQVSIREVLRHRLIDPESVDHAAVEDLVDTYVDEYADTSYINVPSGLRTDMYDTYPFHPVLIDALKTQYFAETESGSARGMLYLFAKVLLDRHAETNLLTHGDVDAVEYNDELRRVNVETSRPDVCYEDIEQRLDDEELPYGRRILSTVLLYSLRQHQNEGADREEILIGTYKTGDRLNDVNIDLQRLDNFVYHLHNVNDNHYVIREDQNPRALIKDAARNIDDDDARQKLSDVVGNIFGPGSFPVGFVEGDLLSVDDSQETKVVVKNSTWIQEEVREVITNGGRGRQWRNTFVFVQPSGEDTVIGENGRYLEKAKLIKGAKLRKEDDSLDPDIRDKIEEEMANDGRQLKKQIKMAYGEVLDGDDLLNRFDSAVNMPLEERIDGAPYNAKDIIDSMEADYFDLIPHVQPILQDLFDRRGEATIEDVYEAFLREPTYPIPGDESDIVNAVAEALEDEPVLAHTSKNGFIEELAGLSFGTLLVPKEQVEQWGVEDVVRDIRQRFSEGTDEIDIGQYELERLRSTDVWVVDLTNPDRDSHDIIMSAFGRLAADERYILVSGTEILDKAQADATLRDTESAERVDTDYLVEQARSAIRDSDSGEADLGVILKEIRSDPELYLPPSETERKLRETINQFLADDEPYLLRINGEFTTAIDEQDPRDVRIVPTLTDRIGEQVLDNIRDREDGSVFMADSIAEEIAGVDTPAVRTFLLRNLGEDDPRYVIAKNGSDNWRDWQPGDAFRVHGGTEPFAFQGDDVTDLLQAWQDFDGGGQVVYGTVAFATDDSPADTVADRLTTHVELDETYVELTLSDGQAQTGINHLFEALPDNADSIDVHIQFQ
jgi:hypothetical protein